MHTHTCTQTHTQTRTRTRTHMYTHIHTLPRPHRGWEPLIFRVPLRLCWSLGRVIQNQNQNPSPPHTRGSGGAPHEGLHLVRERAKRWDTGLPQQGV